MIVEKFICKFWFDISQLYSFRFRIFLFHAERDETECGVRFIDNIQVYSWFISFNIMHLSGLFVFDMEFLMNKNNIFYTRILVSKEALYSQPCVDTFM
jgi:hypothetical protein